MTFYSNMIPFFIISGLLGMGYLAYLFTRVQRPVATGIIVGLIAGLTGPLLFMIPLQACTFEPERESIDYYFGLFLFFLGAVLILGIVQWVARFAMADQTQRSKMVSADTVSGAFNMPIVVPFLLLAPTLAILSVFIYYPAFETFRLSTLLTRLGAPRTRFQCVSNFTELIEPQFSSTFFIVAGITVLLGLASIVLRRRDATNTEIYGYVNTSLSIAALASVYLFLMDFWEEDYADVFFNTVFISSMIVVIGLVISLGIAYLVFQPVKGANIYRTLLIWPYAISPPIAGILFFVMFDPNAGIIDHIMDSTLGVALPNYREDAWLARWVVILSSVWKTLGYNILFYIAGLQNVPKDLVEAAAIDGANAWQRFRNVVIPALSPITFFLIITNLTYAFFETFGTIDYLTKGAPAGATSVAIYEIIQVGVTRKDLGRGAAQSIILFMFVIAVTVWQFRTSGKRVSYGA